PGPPQRSCWRSLPRARRNRSTSDIAPASTDTRTTTNPARPGTTSRRYRVGTARGLPYQSGASGSGCTTDATTTSTGAAAAALAHQRPRGDGRDPVGVSSSTNPAQASQMTVKLKMANPTRYSAAGSDPGRTTSPYLVYHSTRRLRAIASPIPSSSQPTGCRGRRLASTPPTAVELTVASMTAA